jgi:DnaJ-class molecular chaperone
MIKVTCVMCEGTGTQPREDKKKCTICNGKGSVELKRKGEIRWISGNSRRTSKREVYAK